MTKQETRLRGRWLIGPYLFEEDPPQLLSSEGRPVSLRPQALKVLGYLSAHAGELVTKQTLMELVWPDVVVTDDSLVQCIAEIRRILGDAGRDRIVTEARRGYRLFAERLDPPEATWGAPAPSNPDAQPGGDSLQHAEFSQETRFTTSADGTHIALALAGNGPVVLRAPHWMTHLDWDYRTDLSGPRLRALASEFQLIRFDHRGTGLSDRGIDPGRLDQWVEDLEAVVEAAGQERFALFGPSGGGLVAIRYAAKHPERLTCLILVGSMARGALHRGVSNCHVEAFAQLLRDGWAQDNPAFRQLMTSQLWPFASAKQMASFNHMQRVCCDSQTAASLLEAIAATTVEPWLSEVCVPTLVLHGTRDARVPFAEAQLLASRISGRKACSLRQSKSYAA